MNFVFAGLERFLLWLEFCDSVPWTWILNYAISLVIVTDSNGEFAKVAVTRAVSFFSVFSFESLAPSAWSLLRRLVTGEFMTGTEIRGADVL